MLYATMFVTENDWLRKKSIRTVVVPFLQSAAHDMKRKNIYIVAMCY